MQKLRFKIQQARGVPGALQGCLSVFRLWSSDGRRWKGQTANDVGLKSGFGTPLSSVEVNGL